MREMLFRGKRTDNGKWVEGRGIIKNKYWASILTATFIGSYRVRPEYDVNEFSVIPETVGQYTGLTDKNGNKIFEGDIIKHFNNPLSLSYDVYQVFFNETRCMFMGRLHKSWAAELRPNLKYEIIGNIYDNPELIKQEANNGKL